jgi:hypothetical protein
MFFVSAFWEKTPSTAGDAAAAAGSTNDSIVDLIRRNYVMISG